MRKIQKIASLLSCVLVGLLVAPAMADDAAGLKKSGILDQLLKQTGVYDRSKSGKMPDFVADPTWPQPLPHSWLLGQIGGLYVDSHDHVWVYNRPRTLNDDEVGLEKAVAGATDAKGQPVNALGFVRANGFGADCCRAAPSVLEFDAGGKLLRSWGGPADPGFSAANARPTTAASGRTASMASMSTRSNVWIAGNPPPPARRQGNSLDHQQGGRGRLYFEIRHERQFQDADRRHAGGPTAITGMAA